ncbi:phage protein Gp27 family protein [Pseudogemmobacter bohemicus]|uniref:phage protein Gp27 family protein n=1 Tax=Pseudogemmobacter bohemicus TaxID=2250708 RepID=UPI000DD40746|nr:phage protein Gp27 family protein [Pseudogemmobacter bohemicus]
MASGRGRLSSFDLLPGEADGIVAWAAGELADRDRTQTDIYAEFVGKCEALMAEHRGELEFVIPAFSSFNRFSVRQARMSRRLDQTREIVAVLHQKHDAQASDDLTVIAAEMIKAAVLHTLGDADDATAPEDLKRLADGLKAAQLAQNLSSDRKAKITADVQKRLTEAVETTAKARGLTAETTEAIKAEILGVTR